jgi:hypothetical protein
MPRVFFVAMLASALFASFISPQISLFGRGLRFSLLLFFLLGSAILAIRPSAIRYLGTFGVSIGAGLLYVATGTIRYTIDPLSNLFQNLIISAAVCVVLWMIMLVIRKGFPEVVETIRWLILIVLGISLGMGVPLLIDQPGIARLTMANPMANVYAERFYPRGVANYSWYTPLGIAFPVIANWLYKNSRGVIWKFIGWGCLLTASAATLLSTFTMAAGLLIGGALAWLILTILTTKRKRTQFIAIIAVIVTLLFFPTLYYWGSEFDATEFAVNKTTSLIEGISSKGVIEGDMTGRAKMFVDTMDTFLRNPILGLWGLERYFYIGGHSSWADTLGSQGIVGLMLWLVFISPSLHRGKRPFSIEDGAAGGTLAWILLAVGGVLNPTFYNAIGLILLWLFDDGALWRVKSTKVALTQRYKG